MRVCTTDYYYFYSLCLVFVPTNVLMPCINVHHFIFSQVAKWNIKLALYFLNSRSSSFIYSGHQKITFIKLLSWARPGISIHSLTMFGKLKSHFSQRHKFLNQNHHRLRSLLQENSLSTMVGTTDSTL